MKKIEKPWAAVGIFKSMMGKVMSESASSVEIMYIEGQYYPYEIWDSKWVKRFDTPEKLAAWVSGFGDYTYDEAMERLRNDYPSSFKNRKKLCGKKLTR